MLPARKSYVEKRFLNIDRCHDSAVAHIFCAMASGAPAGAWQGVLLMVDKIVLNLP